MGHDRFVEWINHVTPSISSNFAPLPFGVIPTPVALQIAVLEYGSHRWDLERALGNTTLNSDDIAPHGFEFLGGLLPMLSAGGRAPEQSHWRSTCGRHSDPLCSSARARAGDRSERRPPPMPASSLVPSRAWPCSAWDG